LKPIAGGLATLAGNAAEPGSPSMDWSKLQYFPLAFKHFSLLVLLLFVLAAWIEVRALRLAYMRIGLGTHGAVLLLLASLGARCVRRPLPHCAALRERGD